MEKEIKQMEKEIKKIQKKIGFSSLFILKRYCGKRQFKILPP